MSQQSSAALSRLSHRQFRLHQTEEDTGNLEAPTEMRGTPATERDPLGEAIEPREFSGRIAPHFGPRRFLEAENPEQDSGRIKEGVFVRTIECHALIRPRDEMAAGGAIDFSRLFVRDVVVDERVFGVFEHAAV